MAPSHQTACREQRYTGIGKGGVLIYSPSHREVPEKRINW